MNWLNRLKKTKLVAIKNFDEELYRIIKTYASLEDRTITSIFEEALRQWLESRGDYEEVRLWVNLERAYQENLKIFEENLSMFNKYRSGYVLICDGKIIGVFKDYDRVLEEIRNTCKIHSLIIKLPYRKKLGEIDLGFPW